MALFPRTLDQKQRWLDLRRFFNLTQISQIAKNHYPGHKDAQDSDSLESVPDSFQHIFWDIGAEENFFLRLSHLKFSKKKISNHAHI